MIRNGNRLWAARFDGSDMRRRCEQLALTQKELSSLVRPWALNSMLDLCEVSTIQTEITLGRRYNGPANLTTVPARSVDRAGRALSPCHCYGARCCSLAWQPYQDANYTTIQYETNGHNSGSPLQCPA